MVLVTHDRYMLDRISNTVLGLDGQGTAERFADYPQWEAWLATRKQQKDPAIRTSGKTANAPPPPAKKKLSYLEAREWADIEDRIASAEDILQAKQAVLEDPSVAIDAMRLQSALTEVETAKSAVDALYARWAELEAKQA
jgi:ATP-binding cassette subfamily F protein uup